jgi:hypothetical protein
MNSQLKTKLFFLFIFILGFAAGWIVADYFSQDEKKAEIKQFCEEHSMNFSSRSCGLGCFEYKCFNETGQYQIGGEDEN